MECVESASNVTLHASDLEIENNTVIMMESGGNQLDIHSFHYDIKRQFFILNFNTSLLAGKTYIVKIRYTAFLKENLKGFYRSVYTDQTTGNKEYVAVTHFEPNNARKAFPCFDEPALKANFEVKLQQLSSKPIYYFSG